MNPEFYMVWGENCGLPTVKHPSYDIAKRECERLTRQHGGTFYVLAHVATAIKNDVPFTEIHDDGIPF